MALNRLLSLIATEGTEPRLSAVSRWTETPEVGAWDPEPEYGAFVDDEGRVTPGSRPCRAFLDSDDPTLMQWDSETRRKLDQTTVVFLDWGAQDLGWAEVFELWEAWESQGMVVDCGVVGVSWPLVHRWVSPGWIAFRGRFDGSPLAVVTVTAPEPLSFLARAQQLRGGAEEFLPFLPGEPHGLVGHP